MNQLRVPNRLKAIKKKFGSHKELQYKKSKPIAELFFYKTFLLF